MRGDPIHGERIVDGSALTRTALTLYPSGEVTARTMVTGDRLYITDVYIFSEIGGDILLDTGGAAPRTIVDAMLDAKDYLHLHFRQPVACELSLPPQFTGIATGKDVCIIEGFLARS